MVKPFNGRSSISVSGSVEDTGAWEGAYWAAFYKVFGDRSGAVLKAIILAKAKERAGGSPEWETVQRGLEELLGWQARAVMALAEKACHGRPL